MVNIIKNKYETHIKNNRFFGVELEFGYENISEISERDYSTSREISQRALSKAVELAIQHPEIFRGVRLVEDLSIRVALEVVFAPLLDCEFSWNHIQNVLDILKQNGFYVTKGNGMHMHISTFKALELERLKAKTELSKKSLQHQIDNIEIFERDGYKVIDFRNGFSACDGLFQSDTEMEFELVKDIMLRYSKGLKHIEQFIPLSRKDNRFCNTYKMTENAINNATSISDITFGKFTAINLVPFENGTIEFRQALTTLNVDKIIVWFRFLDNLVRYSDTKRLQRIAESIYNVPNSLRPYLTRSNTRQELLYNELYNSDNEIGIQTRDLMDTFGLTSQSIRRLISDIHSTFNRNQINSNDFLITHTFRENGSNYGDGITNTSYQIVKQVNRNTTVELLPENRIGLESIFAELDDDTFSYLHQAKTNRLMRI
tara:strand:- start:170 stop:1459 length:1290 start_codon:yes stop_codon:yes gene_type:complete